MEQQQHHDSDPSVKRTAEDMDTEEITAAAAAAAAVAAAASAAASGEEDNHIIACSAPPEKRIKASYNQLMNEHLVDIDQDMLYHLGMAWEDDFRLLFNDVKFVCMGGSSTRMESFATMARDSLGVQLPVGTGLINLCNSDRFNMYKVGPVLSVSHGMGMPSMSIMLHEITKMLHYANATDVMYIRIGTSGGLGCPPGSIVVTDVGVDGALNPYHTSLILGNVVQRCSKFDTDIIEELVSCRGPHMNIIVGHTMACDDFYEGQARLDGAICEYGVNDKMKFLQRAYDAGVRNIEMECTYLAAFCNTLGIRAAMVASTLLNRLEGDQVSTPKATLNEWSARSQRLVLNFIKRKICQLGATTNTSPVLRPHATSKLIMKNGDLTATSLAANRLSISSGTPGRSSKGYQCGTCGFHGHNARTCPSKTTPAMGDLSEKKA